MKWLNRKYDEDTKKVKEVYRNIKKNDQLEMQNYLDKLAKDEESPVRFEKVIRKSKIKEEKEELLAENIEKSVQCEIMHEPILGPGDSFLLDLKIETNVAEMPVFPALTMKKIELVKTHWTASQDETA